MVPAGYDGHAVQRRRVERSMPLDRSVTRVHGSRWAALLAGAVLLVVLAPRVASVAATATAPRASADTRYSLVHGCFKLQLRPSGTPIAGSAGPFRMQAT